MFSAAQPAEPLAALRVAVRAIETAGRKAGAAHLPFGVDAIDRRLEGGGLALAALHELAGAGPGLADDAAACLFAAGIAGRAHTYPAEKWEPVFGNKDTATKNSKRTILWALSRRDLFAPALAQAGLPPDRLIYAECGRDEDVLAAMEEGLRHGGLGAVVGEVGRAAMASTRRLQLAAEQGGTLALMLRRWRRTAEDPLGQPSAAVTRWRIGCAPSAELAVPGVARPRWRAMLVRQRGGEPCEWIVESSDAEGRLALPAASAHRPPAVDGAERRAA